MFPDFQNEQRRKEMYTYYIIRTRIRAPRTIEILYLGKVLYYYSSAGSNSFRMRNYCETRFTIKHVHYICYY